MGPEFISALAEDLAVKAKHGSEINDTLKEIVGELRSNSHALTCRTDVTQ
jgi:hypothetical protein